MDPSLYEALNNTIVRLNVTCNDDEFSCIEFTATFTDATPYSYTAPFVFNDTCYHGFSTGERAPSVKVPAASPEGPSRASSLGSNYTIILAGKADQGLPWSEGFDADGQEKDDEFWSVWWATTHKSYGGRDSSSGDDGRCPVSATYHTDRFCFCKLRTRCACERLRVNSLHEYAGIRYSLLPTNK